VNEQTINFWGSFLYQVDQKTRDLLNFVSKYLLENSAVVEYRTRILQRIYSFSNVKEENSDNYILVPGFKSESPLGTVLSQEEISNFQPLINFVPIKFFVDGKLFARQNFPNYPLPWINEYEFLGYFKQGVYKIINNSKPIHIRKANQNNYIIINEQNFNITQEGCYYILFETLDDTFNTIITREINEIDDLFGMIINPGLINFYRNYISFFGEQGGSVGWKKLWHRQMQSFFNCLFQPSYLNLITFFNLMFGFKYGVSNISGITDNGIYYSKYSYDDEQGIIVRYYPEYLDYFNYVENNIKEFFLFVNSLNYNYVSYNEQITINTLNYDNFKLTNSTTIKHTIYVFKQPKVFVINLNKAILYCEKTTIYTPVYNMFFNLMPTIRQLLPSQVPLGFVLSRIGLGNIPIE
jgi:hypothetical protein